jgi:hypothetical protein
LDQKLALWMAGMLAVYRSRLLRGILQYKIILQIISG